MNPAEPDAGLLPTILAICEDYFAHASPAVHRELDTVLRAHDISGGPGWLVDMLRSPGSACTPPRTSISQQLRIRVRSKLAEIDHQPSRSTESKLTSLWCRLSPA